jgi:hypothetical protein
LPYSDLPIDELRRYRPDFAAPADLEEPGVANDPRTLDRADY